MPVNPRPSPLYLLIGALSFPVLRGLYRFRGTGTERVPVAGGYVLAANHISNADPWPLGMALFPTRYLRFMAKSELFWFPLGPFIGACGAFPVRRGERDQEAIETAIRLCREGHVVVMFPEGTRRAKGLRKRHEARWRSGAARIALEAGVPLVPAGIRGTDGLSRLSRLSVAFGDPIELGDLAGVPIEEAAHAATERLSETIGALEASLS
jgi:1-acyl-sn-glycerol-3-phosphate acyltransferase